jgi:hypothetical protein
LIESLVIVLTGIVVSVIGFNVLINVTFELGFFGSILKYLGPVDAVFGILIHELIEGISVGD